MATNQVGDPLTIAAKIRCNFEILQVEVPFTACQLQGSGGLHASQGPPGWDMAGAAGVISKIDQQD